MARSDFERQITAIASLGDPVRRGLYLYVGKGRKHTTFGLTRPIESTLEFGDEG